MITWNQQKYTTENVLENRMIALRKLNLSITNLCNLSQVHGNKVCNAEVSKQEKNYVLSAINPNFTIRLTKIDTVNKIISGDFFGVLFNRALDSLLTQSLCLIL